MTTSPEHISDFEFDRFMAHELDHDDRGARVHAHLHACPACANRYEALQAHTVTFQGQASQRALPERIVRQAHRQRHRAAGLGAAVVALGGLVIAVGGGALHHLSAGTALPLADLRAKGSVSLDVIKARPGMRAESMLPGDMAVPGDTLQFRVVSQTSGFLAIASVDGAGTVSLYAPQGDAALLRIEKGQSLIAGAVELDQVLGPERLMALVCPRPLPGTRIVTAIQTGLRAAGGQADALDEEGTGLGCTHASFSFRKGTAP